MTHDIRIDVVEAAGHERGDIPDEANLAEVAPMVAVGSHAPNFGRLIITQGGETGLAAVGIVHGAHGDVDLHTSPKK